MPTKEQREKDLSSKKRCIFFTGEVDENSSKNFINALLRLEMEDPAKDILLIIDSYGGYVDSMWSMIDVMNLCRCKIHTLCVGKSMSAASLMLMNGAKGRRYCTPNSRVMIHKISSGHAGGFDELDNHMKEIARMEEQLESFIIENSKFTKKSLQVVLQNDYYLTATQAKKQGVIDKIITSFSDLKLKGW